jgi:iron complex outermembrane receptor protein
MPSRSLQLSIWLLGWCGLTSAAAQTGTIAGQVTSASMGSPVAGALITVLNPAGMRVSSVYADREGQYRLTAVPPGVYTVVVSAFDHLAHTETGVVVDARATTRFSVTLRAGVQQLEEIVVGVSGLPERVRETPGAVELIPRQQVEETTVLVPTEYLKGRAGVDFAQTGLMSTTVVARGFSSIFSTSLLSITDHRYTNLPSLRGNVAFLMPAVSDDIERIEVMPGPGSALYGPNAANGVVHTITRSPFSSPGTTLTIGGGEREVVLASVRHAGIVGKRLGYKVTGQVMRGREWPFVDTLEVIARDDNLSRWSGEVRLDYRFDSTAEASVTAGRVTAERAIENTPFGAAQGVGWDFSYYQARFDYKRLFVQAFLNSTDGGGSFWLRSGDAIQDKSRLLAVQARHRTSLGERQTFIYGIDLQRTDPRTFGTIHGRFEDDDDSEEVGAYLHSRTVLSSRFDLVLAARYDHHSRVEKNVFSPRAALVFTPSQAHNLRLSYNRAFGTPLTSELFIDLPVGSLDPLPFDVRAVGAVSGWRFRRDCGGGVCVRSPFPADGESSPAPGQFRDLDATRFWNAVAALTGIQGIPAPTTVQVGTLLRMLGGAVVSAASLTDIEPLRPTISHTWEFGYKGVLANRVSVALDVWRQRRVDFVAEAAQQTPTMHLDPATLAVYLAAYLPAEEVAEAARTMADIPLGTAGFDHPMTADHNVYVSYRNFGEVKLWGSDLSVETWLTNRLALTGTYSWLSDDTFRTADAQGNVSEIVMNAPANKGSLGMRWSDDSRGLSANARVRFVDGFPMRSAIYTGRVESHTTMDVGMSFRLRALRNALITTQAQNVLDNEHQEFLGSPSIGRLVTARVSFRL